MQSTTARHARFRFGLLALLAALCASPTLDADITIGLGNHALLGEASDTVEVSLNGTLADFEIALEYVDGGPSEWAADMILQITDPQGMSCYWGGYDVTPVPEALFMSDWSFCCGNSTYSGTYFSDFNPTANLLSGAGTWTFKIYNGWSPADVCEYNDVTLTLKGLSGGEIVQPTSDPLPKNRWTVIVHGRQDLDFDELTTPGGWMYELGKRIKSLDPKVNVYRCTNPLEAAVPVAGLEGTADPDDPSRHHVVLCGWRETSNEINFVSDAGDDGFAYAAADALFAGLQGWGVADRIQTIIGYSRGAVVTSECVRRMLAIGVAPAQVVYVDGEGCVAGDDGPFDNECDYYEDGVFRVWETPPGQNVRFDNIFSTYDEEGWDCSGPLPDLGGHHLSAAFNRNLLDHYAHPTGCEVGGESVPMVAEFLIAGLTFDGLGQRFQWPESPGIPTEDNTSEPATPIDSAIVPAIEIPFNGTLGWNSLAGWMGNGGNPAGGLFGDWLRVNASGEALTHCPFYVPPGATSLSFTVTPSGSSTNVSTLSVELEAVEVPTATLASVLPNTIPLGEERTFSCPIPSEFRGRTVRLSFVATGTWFSQFALVRNVRISTLHDFNRDFRADLVFHHPANKQAKVWYMSGLERIGAELTSANPGSWESQGIGDFNGDGAADLLWRDSSGYLRIWLMDGANVISNKKIIGGTALGSYSVVGVGDVDGDQNADILLRNTNGTVKVWFMEGIERRSAKSFGSSAGLEFLASGDIDGDGKSDLVWRNSLGKVSAWLLDADGVVDSGEIENASSMGSAWSCPTAGDLDGDGRTDLIWRKSNSDQVKGWLLDGFTRKDVATIGTLAPTWTLECSGDLNGDGRTDLIWRKTGQSSMKGWLMDGLDIIDVGTMDSATSSWHIVNR